MLGRMDKSQFNPATNYNKFYEQHKFEPFPQPFDSHEILPRAAWTLDAANEIKAESLLDLCCLDGFVSLTLAKHCPTMKTVRGVDLSEPGIARANELGKTLDKDIKYVQRSVEEYLFESTDKYDMILLFEAVEHFKNTPMVLELVKAHLTPQGQVLISTPSAEHFYGIGNDDACHLRYYFNREERDRGDLPVEWEGRPIVSLVDELKTLGGIIVDNDIYNDLIHLRARFQD